MALFLNGRALCRGLIPLSGPRGTLRKQSLRRTYLFLLGISLCHKYESCSEVPTAAHSSALLFGRQHVRVAAEANPQHDRIHWLYIHWFSQYLVLSNYEAMFSNSYCDSTCIGLRRESATRCAPPQRMASGCLTKKHFLIISNNYCMVLGTEGSAPRAA